MLLIILNMLRSRALTYLCSAENTFSLSQNEFEHSRIMKENNNIITLITKYQYFVHGTISW